MSALHGFLAADRTYHNLAAKLRKIYNIVINGDVFVDQSIFNEGAFVAAMNMVMYECSTAPLSLAGIQGTGTNPIVRYDNNDLVMINNVQNPNTQVQSSGDADPIASWVMCGGYDCKDTLKAYRRSLEDVVAFSHAFLSANVAQIFGLYMKHYGQVSPVFYFV